MVSNDHAVVCPAIISDFAENVCRPAAENVVGHKEFIGSRPQAMGEAYGWPIEVRKHPICNANVLRRSQEANLPFSIDVLLAATTKSLPSHFGFNLVCNW